MSESRTDMAPRSTQTGAARARTGMTRLTAGLTVGGIGWVIPFPAAATVLLPARLAEPDPERDLVGAVRHRP